MEAIKSLNKPFIDPSPGPLKPSPAVPHNHVNGKGAKAKGSTKLFSPRKVEDTMNQFGLNMHRSQNDDDVSGTNFVIFQHKGPILSNLLS